MEAMRSPKAISEDREDMLRRQGGMRAKLREWREGRRWSQERLSVEAELDHSLVSRIESGQRVATRRATERLALALRPDDARARAELLLLAGYVPDLIEPMLRFAGGSLYGDLWAALHDKAQNKTGHAFLLMTVTNAIATARYVQGLEGTDE